MKSILLIGAGKSATVLIDYLLEQADKQDWRIVVGDLSVETAREKLAGHERGEAIYFDVNDPELRSATVEKADLVISMLPARFHHLIVEQCIRYKKNFLSASYVSKEIQGMAAEIEAAGISVIKEMGLDPGIDHMSAMEKLDELRAAGASISEFETFTGGLVAPDYENNPWGYKFTWNPRNVVLAGQGIVKFKHNGMFKYIPYHKLFSRFELLDVPGWGAFEGYPNRDSLKYREAYGLTNVHTIYRGTLRRPGFCKAWDVFVQLGMTDDTYTLENLSSMTYRDFINSFLWWDKNASVELKLAAYLKLDFNNEIMDKLTWLGIFDRTPIGMERGTPAQVLQKLLEEKLSLDPEDKDMIVMLHKYVYTLAGVERRLQSSMVVIGDDPVRTAMAKTVGLPLGITANNLLNGKIDAKGIVIPTSAAVYKPVLRELEQYGIVFEETEFATPTV